MRNFLIYDLQRRLASFRIARSAAYQQEFLQDVNKSSNEEESFLGGLLESVKFIVNQSPSEETVDELVVKYVYLHSWLYK